MFVRKMEWYQSMTLSNFINDLEGDISYFGTDLIVEVIAEDIDGMTIYKDYQFTDDDEPELRLKLEPWERLEQMPAVKLLELYRQQASR